MAPEGFIISYDKPGGPKGSIGSSGEAGPEYAALSKGAAEASIPGIATSLGIDLEFVKVKSIGNVPYVKDTPIRS